MEKLKLLRLVRRAQKGDAQAFGHIYDHFYDSIYGYVLHLVGTPADAEDVTAGVFLAAFEKIDSYTWQGAGIGAWLFSIARNDVLDFFRKRGRMARETYITEEHWEQPATATVEDLAEASWNKRALLNAIRHLSEDQQQVLILKLVANLSNKEAGSVLAKSEGAIKALQHRALASLRKVMAEEIAERV